MINEDDKMTMPDPATPDGGVAHEGAEGEAPEPNDESALSSAAVRAKMKIPPQMQKAYERIVQAGLKLMFDPRTREQTMQMMMAEGDPVQKIAQGVGSVMVALFQQSNGTMPQELIIPAAVELVAHVVEVAQQAGASITPEQYGAAVEQTIAFIGQKFGVNLDGQQPQPEQAMQPTQQPAGLVGMAQGAA